MSARCFRRPNLLLALPVMLSAAAAFLALRSSPAPAATPDPLNPLFKSVAGPFRPQLTGGDHSQGPSPTYSEAERRRLVAEGKDLFFSTSAFGQQPSQGPLVFGQFLSCATCHVPPGFTDGLTHLVGPVREREVARRQTPSILGVAGSAPYGWDGRNAHLQGQSRGAIVSPLEMHASREPTRRELDALAEFQRSLAEPPAVPGRDYDPARAARGEVLFRTPRPVTDSSGEFAAGTQVACATCHAGPFFTDGKAHREVVVTGDPLLDPGEVGPDGTIAGFHTPSLLGARLTVPYFHDGSGADPTSDPNQDLGGGAAGPATARRALLGTVLPFYNTVHFNFGFTDEELKDLAEFILSL